MKYLVTGEVEVSRNPSPLGDPQQEWRAFFPYSEQIEAASPQSAIASAMRDVAGTKSENGESFSLDAEAEEITTSPDESAFDEWWNNEGSGMPPLTGEDAETHVHRISRIAWLNGAFKVRFCADDTPEEPRENL